MWATDPVVSDGASQSSASNALGPTRLVEHGDSIAVGNEPIVEILDDEQRRCLGHVVVATAQPLGGAGHDDCCLDPGVTAAAVGDQAQRRDGAVGMACGPDLVRVDETRQRPVRGAVRLEHLAYDEAHVTRLVPDVPGVGTAGRLAARQGEQRSSHHVARGCPGSEQLAVLLRRAPQAMGKDDQRVGTLTRRVGRSRPRRIPDGRDQRAGRPCRHAVPGRGGPRRVDEGHRRGRHGRRAGCSNGRRRRGDSRQAVAGRSRPQATAPDSAARRLGRIRFSLPDERPSCHKPCSVSRPVSHRVHDGLGRATSSRTDPGPSVWERSFETTCAGVGAAELRGAGALSPACCRPARSRWRRRR